MDERQALQTETGLGGDIGENVAAAEYDVAEAERPAARTGTPLVTGSVTGEEVDVKGAVGLVRADETKVYGLAALALGSKTKVAGWAEVAAARDEVEIEKGAAAIVLAGRKVELEDHGYAALVVAPKVEVRDGGRVLITALAAVLGGLAIGTGFGLVVIGGIWLMRRRGFFMQKPGEKSVGARVEAQLNRRIRGAIRGALRG